MIQIHHGVVQIQIFVFFLIFCSLKIFYCFFQIVARYVEYTADMFIWNTNDFCQCTNFIFILFNKSLKYTM